LYADGRLLFAVSVYDASIRPTAAYLIKLELRGRVIYQLIRIKFGTFIELRYAINFVKFGDDRSHDWGLVSIEILRFCLHEVYVMLFLTLHCAPAHTLRVSNGAGRCGAMLGWNWLRRIPSKPMITSRRSSVSQSDINTYCREQCTAVILARNLSV